MSEEKKAGYTAGPWRIRNGTVGDSVLAGSVRICLVDRVGPMEANARLRRQGGRRDVTHPHPSPEDVRAAMRWREDQHRKVFAVGRKNGGETVLRRRSSWCSAWLQAEPEGPWIATDGMCEPCSDDFKREAGL